MTGLVAELTSTVQQWSLLQGLCDTALTGMLVVASLVAIDYYWRPASVIGRWLICLPFWFSLAWMAVRRLRPIASRRNLQARVVASLCESYAPLQDRLPAALDFERSLASEPARIDQRGSSVSLMRHVVQQTRVQLSQVELPQWVNLPHARRTLMLTTGLLLVGLCTLGFRSELILTGVPRVMVPWYQGHWPSWYQLMFDELPTEVLPFTTVPVRVISRTGQLPGEVWLETRAAAPDGNPPSSLTAAPGITTPAEISPNTPRRDRYPLVRQGDAAVGELTMGAEPLWVRVIGDGDPNDQWHRIAVVQPPRLLETTAWEVHWPASDRTIDVRVPWGPLRVPATAQIAIHGEFDCPVSRVDLELLPSSPITSPAPTTQHTAEGRTEPHTAQRFQLDIAGPRFQLPRGSAIRIEGPMLARLTVRYSNESSPLVVGTVPLTVHEDQPPAVEWQPPPGSFGSNVLMATPTAQLQLPIHLADDQRVTDYRLVVSAEGEGSAAVIAPNLDWVSVTWPPDRPELLQTALARPDTSWPTTTMATHCVWPPTGWIPPTDSIWNLQVVVRDSAGQETRSSQRMLRIVSVQQLEAACLAELADLSRLAGQTAARLNDWPAWRDQRPLTQLTPAERLAWIGLIENSLTTASGDSSGLMQRLTHAGTVAHDNQLLAARNRQGLEEIRLAWADSLNSYPQRLLDGLRSDAPTDAISAEYRSTYGRWTESWQKLADALEMLCNQRNAASELLTIWQRQVELSPGLSEAQRAVLSAGGRTDAEPVAGQLRDWATAQHDTARQLSAWLERYGRSSETTVEASPSPSESIDPFVRISSSLQARLIAQRMERLSEEVAAGRIGQALPMYRAVTVDFYAAISADPAVMPAPELPHDVTEQPAGETGPAMESSSDSTLDRLRRLAAATTTALADSAAPAVAPTPTESGGTSSTPKPEALSRAQAKFWTGLQWIVAIQRQLRGDTLTTIDGAPPAAERDSAVLKIADQQQELAMLLNELVQEVLSDGSDTAPNPKTGDSEQPVDDELDRDLFSGPDAPPSGVPPTQRRDLSQSPPTARDSSPAAAALPSSPSSPNSPPVDWQRDLADFQRLAEAMDRAAGLVRQHQLTSAAVLQLQILQRLDELVPAESIEPTPSTTAGGDAGASTGGPRPLDTEPTPSGRPSTLPADQQGPIRIPAGWGKLPKREQQEIPAVEAEQFLPGYETFIRDYFQRLGP
ncbi:MAG: hypothetical protein U0795_09470 [Pirellulales bacterium]